MPIPIAVTDWLLDAVPDAFSAAAGEQFTCLRAPLEEAALAAFIRAHGVRHAVVDVTPMKGPVYDALPRGGVLARFGVGYDSLDLPRASAAGILCTNTPGVLDAAVVEHTIHLLLSLARHAPYQGDRGWTHQWRDTGLGFELAGRTLVVVGCGPIGRRVGRAAALGLGMRVIGCDPYLRDTDILLRDFGFHAIVPDLAAALPDADVLTLHIPGTAANHHYIDAARLAAFPPGLRLINTARGSLIDEAALYDALASGRLAGAALDVFAQEPYVPADPSRDLRTLRSAILTDHQGSATREAFSRIATRAVANIRHAVDGNPAAMDLLNPGALPA